MVTGKPHRAWVGTWHGAVHLFIQWKYSHAPTQAWCGLVVYAQHAAKKDTQVYYWLACHHISKPTPPDTYGTGLHDTAALRMRNSFNI